MPENLYPRKLYRMKNNNLEIEMRFDGVDTDEFRKTLKSVGAKMTNKKRIMPITTFYHPRKKKDIYIRVRDEGKQITMTVKTNLRDKYPIEREVEINSSEEGIAILTMLGCKKKYHIEKMRETWNISGCKEIVIDSYPGLPEYIEIDCHTENSLFCAADKLGIKIKKDHKNPSVTDMYWNLYGIPKIKPCSEDLTFKNAMDVLGKLVTKNKSKFTKILKEQQSYHG